MNKDTASQDRLTPESPYPKIVTSHVFPPIPDRRYDWIAYYEGQEEYGNYGSGPTEQDAPNDFIENYQDDEDNRLGIIRF